MTDADLLAGRRRLVAILRGIRPAEAPAVLDALAGAGIALIEVPLNSPEPFESIRIMAARAAGRLVIGAGTVLAAEDVGRVAEAGGRLVVSPNVEPAVIRAARVAGLYSCPGVFTPTEALAALAAGADALKFFPADVLGPGGIRAIRAVLPAGTRCLAVGGVGAENLDGYAAAGVAGFGIGSSLYVPGLDAREVAARAARLVAAYDAAIG